MCSACGQHSSPDLVRVLAAGNLQVERSSLHGLGTALQKAVGDVVMAVLVKVRCNFCTRVPTQVVASTP